MLNFLINWDKQTTIQKKDKLHAFSTQYIMINTKGSVNNLNVKKKLVEGDEQKIFRNTQLH